MGALRKGEIVGLTPEDLDFDAADGIGTFRINKSMQWVRKEALNQVDDGCIIKVFPDKLERSTTSLILKGTKTAPSCRTIFMTSALKEELKKWLNQLAADEMKDPTRYPHPDSVHQAQMVSQDLHPVCGDGAESYRAVSCI